MQRTLLSIAFLSWSTVLPAAELDVAALNEAYKAYDASINGGKGHSESADSGVLGWAEGSVLESYAAMWESTQDAYWLAKIADHFARIMANASDPDGDGYLSWQTKTYSCALAYAERLSNQSAADIEPAVQKVTNGDLAQKCGGQSYLLECSEKGSLRLCEYLSGKVLATFSLGSGGAITAIEPFRFKMVGQPMVGDRFLVRTVAPEPLEYTVHQGMVIYPVAQFIEAVKTRGELQSRFGAQADAFLSFINRHVFEKNELDWLDLGQSGAYRFEPRLTDRNPNGLMPHNQYAALARAYLVLASVEGAHRGMGRRAEQMVRYFHDHLELDESHDAYRWHYWDWTLHGEPARAVYEDYSHARINVSLAVEAARRGVVFTEQDLGRMARTWVEVMCNQDKTAPRMASRVDGRPPHEASPLTSHWTELAQWNRSVYELALQAFQSMSDSRRRPHIPTLLLAAHRAGRAD